MKVALPVNDIAVIQTDYSSAEVNSMPDCRICQHWFDHPLDANPEAGTAELFYGCHLHGRLENFECHPDCPDFLPHSSPYAECPACGTRVPRICILLGECTWCTDTSYTCRTACTGGEWKTGCPHWNKELAEPPPGQEAGPAGSGAEPARPGSLSDLLADYLARHPRAGRSRPPRR